jgi:lipopolysaccharide biosynthesis glycosyltransferase
MIKEYRVFVGFDQREAIAFHTFSQSIISNASVPVSITALSLTALRSMYQEKHGYRSNDFIYSRFLVPHLSNYNGIAVFADGDMILEADIRDLFEQSDPSKAVQVVKHDYKTKAKHKYLGNKNENYPRKNWSSVILWNCAHPAHRVLTPDFISEQTGSFLHRFSWLSDDLIGELDIRWNWLAEEYPIREDANLIHYTLGTPCFSDYSECAQSNRWHYYNAALNEGFDK